MHDNCDLSKLVRQFKVGAIQAEPVWLKLEGGVVKTKSLIKKAGADGAKVHTTPLAGWQQHHLKSNASIESMSHYTADIDN